MKLLPSPFVLAVAGPWALVVAAQGPAALRNDPVNPIAPTSYRQCSELDNEWNQRLTLLRKQNGDCDMQVYRSCQRLPLAESNQCFAREKNPAWRLGEYPHRVDLYIRCESSFQALRAAEARWPVALKQCRDEVAAALARNANPPENPAPSGPGAPPPNVVPPPRPTLPPPVVSPPGPPVNAPPPSVFSNIVVVQRLKAKYEQLSARYEELMNRTVPVGGREVPVESFKEASKEMAEDRIVELLKDLPLTSLRNVLLRSVGRVADNPIVGVSRELLKPDNAEKIYNAAVAAQRSRATGSWNEFDARQLEELRRAEREGR